MTGIPIGARLRAEAKLVESEQRFRALVTAGTLSVYRMSPDWRLMYQLDSETLASTSEPIEDWVDRYMPKDDLPRVKAAVAQAIAAKSLFELEHQVMPADGGIGWVLSRAIPLLGPDGEITEWFGAGSDITARKRAQEALRDSEERQAFLLQLSDALRPLADATEVQRTAMDQVAERLGVESAVYVEFEPDGDHATITQGHRSTRIPFPPKVRLSDFGQVFFDDLTAGRNILYEDAETDPRLEASRGAYRPLDILSGVGVPLIKAGRLAAALAVNHTEPRPWPDADLRLLEEVAERTWAAVERARAEAALRRSEERHRSLFETIRQGFSLAELVRDAAGNAVDWRLLELNPVFEEYAGMTVAECVGRTVADIFGSVDPYWLAVYDRVVRTRKAERIEAWFGPMDRWVGVDV